MPQNDAESFFGISFNESAVAQEAIPEQPVKEKKAPISRESAFSFFGIDFGSKPVKEVSVSVKQPKPEILHTVDDVLPHLIDAESGGKHVDEKTGKLIQSKTGALGITQILPSTASKPGYGIKPLKDQSEKEYRRLGKEYLQKLHEKFGDWEKALGAYNAGVGNVAKAVDKAERFGGDWKDYLPEERKAEAVPYIKKIMKRLRGEQAFTTSVEQVAGVSKKEMDRRKGMDKATVGIRGAKVDAEEGTV